ncbi:MAG: hypothetical protein ABWW69_02720 [Pyrodictiaceae archaeon]
METGVKDTIRGGTWLYLSAIVVSAAGFIYWLVIARIAGAEAVGFASGVISASAIASTVVAAGANIAAIRFLATHGLEGIVSLIVFGLAASGLALAAVIPLVVALGYGLDIAAIALSYTAISLVSTLVVSGLIGLERFRRVFRATATASVFKLAVGFTLVALGLGGLGALLGYLAFPSTILAVVLPGLVRRVRKTASKLFGELKEIIILTYSNYPYAFSNQLLVMLSVYLTALLTGREVSTGAFYIAMMIVAIMAALPSSLINASLPIGIHRRERLVQEGLRLGLALLLPLTALLAVLAEPILKMISPELVEASTSLEILLLSIVPFTALTALVTELNRRGELRPLITVGVARTLLLLVLTLVLAPAYGIDGVALAFLAANSFTALLLAFLDQELALYMLRLWPQYIAVIVLGLVSDVNHYIVAVASLALSITMLYATRTLEAREVKELALLVASILQEGRE